MKRIGMMFVFFLAISFIDGNAFAQQKTKLSEGLYIVDYGGTYVIEDDIHQRSISIQVVQTRIDEKNNEIYYEVICGNTPTRMIKKEYLKRTIAQAIIAATEGSGITIANSIGETAAFIYDLACDYWDRKNRENRNR